MAGGLALVGAIATTAILPSSSLAAGGATLVANKTVAGVPATLYGSPITLSGHSAASSKGYSVQAQGWPFKGAFKTVRTGTTSATGNYAFNVKPGHATKYRVVISGGTSSSVLTVYVLERRISFTCNVCVINNAPGPATMKVAGKFQWPPGPIGNKNLPVYLYYALNSSTVVPTKLYRVATASRHFNKNTYTFSFNYKLNFPNVPAFRFAELICVKHDLAADGVGIPGNHGCGKASVSRLRYVG